MAIVFWILPILVSLPEMQVLKDQNPFLNQTAYTPFWLIISFITVPFLISLFVENFQQVLNTSFTVISILFLGLFLYNAYSEGWYNNLVVGFFDISYLGVVIPFTLFAYLTKRD